MNSNLLIRNFAWILCFFASQAVNADERDQPRKVVLVAGETAKIDHVGHHDYLAGCACLEVLLRQTNNITVVRVENGWPEDTSVFDRAATVVFYTDGGGKQAFLATPERVAQMQSLVDQGVGVVMLHQAVDYPAKFAQQAKSWLGGIYLQGESGRGHWPSSHIDFPEHPIPRGVTPWHVNDGWLNNLIFVDKLQGVTPLVWSGKELEESRAGVQPHIVGWAYERPVRGRSFSFTGLDSHSAWELTGLRQLVLNGVLWSAGVEIPKTGASCEVDQAALNSMLTPRTPKVKTNAAQ